MYEIKLESLVWAYDEKGVQCIKYQLLIWNYVNGIVLCNMTRLSSALATKKCDRTLKDPVVIFWELKVLKLQAYNLAPTR